MTTTTRSAATLRAALASLPRSASALQTESAPQAASMTRPDAAGQRPAARGLLIALCTALLALGLVAAHVGVSALDDNPQADVFLLVTPLVNALLAVLGAAVLVVMAVFGSSAASQAPAAAAVRRG
ncbi:hypothetical protein [Falsarthrobacter nasiphocae]|uniref:Uncharacterized protein n=1 Tax=Falsarthrobacter nasiphocae TaxID=189863 RepID=A0AAE4C786_9MICC|nr:hypothetical protein [Falsarthrobacter nasiphocae]MDR6891205.1 hypothetical protein [Falsarthrobacter nasiphocae]